MPTKFRVTAVNAQQDGSFQGRDGNLVSLTDYHLSLTNLTTGQEGVAWLSQKPETASPQVGQEIEGDLTAIPGGPNKGQMKLRKPKPANFGGGGGKGGYSPEREKSIARQTAAKCAAEVIAARMSTDSGTGVGDVLIWTNAFYAAITEQPVQTTEQQAVQPPEAPAQQPAPTTDDGIPF